MGALREVQLGRFSKKFSLHLIAESIRASVAPDADSAPLKKSQEDFSGC
jgi:hypothetical protein